MVAAAQPVGHTLVYPVMHAGAELVHDFPAGAGLPAVSPCLKVVSGLAFATLIA